MRYLSLVSVSPAVDDCQLSPCVKKQSIVLLNGTDSKTSYRYILNVFGALQCQLLVKKQYSASDFIGIFAECDVIFSSVLI